MRAQTILLVVLGIAAGRLVSDASIPLLITVDMTEPGCSGAPDL